MPLQLPDLDTRTFDQLMTMARLRIPRYAPEWTDFNESDPGITLVELFAWLTEMLFHEMNRIPELNYITLLQLLGQELTPAQPARAYLTVKADPSTAGIPMDPLPPRTQAVAQASSGPIIFETMEDLSLVRLALTSVQYFDGATFNDVTKANDSGGSSYPPLGWRPQNGCALYLGFAPPPPSATGAAPAAPAAAARPDSYFPAEIHLRAFLPAAVQAANAVSCAGAGSPPASPVTLVWEYSRKGQPRWGRLNVTTDDSLAFTREGDIVVEGPGADKEARREGRADTDMYWLRARLDGITYPGGQAPQIEFIRPNVVLAENLVSVRDEPLGSSQGLPNQSYTLRHVPIWQPQGTAAGADVAPPEGSLVVQVTETDGNQAVIETWRQVKNFLAAGPDDQVYTLNAATGEVTFGDGRNGRVPMPMAAIDAAYYRYGGGAVGNVAAGKIASFVQPVNGVTVVNERGAVGGSDEQTVDDLKQTAQDVLRHRNRAVSQADFADLAAQIGGVAKAQAVPLAHPDFPGVDVPGAVTVVVVPDSPEPQPRPEQALLEAVCASLDGARLLTTEMFVKEPVYLPVHVEVHVLIQPYASADMVACQVTRALNAFLDPLGRVPVDDCSAGDTPDAPGWDFGENFYPTGLYGPVLHVKDVVSVTSLTVTVNGRRQDLNDAALVPSDGLICSACDHIVVAERLETARTVRPVA